jgi:hypothetical protein
VTTADEVQARNRHVLSEVRIRRDRLYDAVLSLERAIAAPAGDHAPRWAATLAAPVDNLREVLEAHVAQTEGGDGLFEQMRDDAPHLLNAVERLRDEHTPLLVGVQQLADLLPGVNAEPQVDAVRAAALDLVRRILEHRHRGAELLYDAYSVDVSAGD